jgi:hypothetical protein
MSEGSRDVDTGAGGTSLQIRGAGGYAEGVAEWFDTLELVGFAGMLDVIVNVQA